MPVLLATWLGFFLFSLIAAFSVQLIVLPLFLPHLDAGMGLLARTDAVRFHELAVQMAEKISTEGWSAWTFQRQEAGIPTTVSAFFYALFTPKPWVLIPFHAAVHAGSALMIVVMLRRIFHSDTAAVIGALPFLMFPSALAWYSQIHREGYFLLGFLLIVHGWMQISALPKFASHKIFLIPLEIAVGSALVWVARNSVFQVMLNFSYLLAAVLLAYFLYKKAALSVGVLLLSLLAMKAFETKGMEYEIEHNFAPVVVNGRTEHQVIDRWKNTPLIPDAVEMRLRQISLRRNSYRVSTYDKRGLIDNDVEFSNAWDIVRYIPRALQIGVLAPFPSHWFSEGVSTGGTYMRRVSAVEMFVVYIGLVFFLWNASSYVRSRDFWIMFFFSFSLLLTASLTVNQLGALYRYRYGYLTLLIGFGFASITKLDQIGLGEVRIFRRFRRMK